MADKIFRVRKPHSFNKLIVWSSLDESDIAASPTLTSGSGAPSASEPNGSMYFRTNGVEYNRVAGAWAAKPSLTNFGVLSSLTTTDKASLVAAINEVDANADTGIANAATADGKAVTAQSTANAALPKAGGQMSGNITMAGAETVDGRDLSADGTQLDAAYPVLVKVVINATGAAASNDGSIDVDVQTLADVNVASARMIMLNVSGTQYLGSFGTQVATVTFSAATVGSLVLSGNGWAIVKTDATGNFSATLSDSADETVYVSACSIPGGVSAAGEGCVVVESNSDAATWSA